MSTSRFGTLQALTTAVLALHITLAENSKPGDGPCKAVITKSCELKWSVDQQAFLASTHEDEPSALSGKLFGAAERSTSLNRGLWCIRAPERHRIVAKITMETSENKKTCDQSSNCAVSCLAIREARATNATKNQFEHVNFSSDSLDVSVVFFNRSDLFRVLSRFGGPVERFVRQTVVKSQVDFEPLRVEMPKKRRRFDVFSTRRRHRTRGKRKQCPKRPCRRKPKCRNNLLKDIATELLREIHKKSERLPGANSTAFIARALMRNPEFKAARRRINHLIKMDRRRRTSSSRPPAPFNASRWTLRASNSNTLSNAALHLSGEGAIDHKRTKRASRTLTEEPLFKKVFRRHVFCEPNANRNAPLQYNSSKTENFPVIKLQGKGSETSNSTPVTIDWRPLDFPMRLRSDGRELRINIESALGADNTLRRQLVVQLTFESYTESPEEPKPKSFCVSIGTASIEDQQPRRPVSANSSRLKTAPMSLPTSAHDLSVVSSENDILALTIGAITGAACLVGLVAGACLFLFRRARRRNSSKARRKHFTYEAESEKCLAGAEACDERPSFGLTENENCGEGFGKVTVADSERRMLEHKNRSKRGHGRSSNRHEAVATVNRQDRRSHHVSKSTHAQTARGMPPHEHCMVYHQIADKPHQPIVTAQYTSEFLPTAGRHLTGCSANLTNSHDIFDKFNRMQNNPYRNSPRLPPKTASLPWTVKLPDGEERHRGRQEHKLTVTAADDNSQPVCIKPPPNRTVFGSVDLPFSTVDDNNRKPKPGGYPGPPSSACKAVTLRDYNFNPANACHHDPTSEARRGHKDGCICRYILNRIDEPPPEYSDIVGHEPQSGVAGVCVLEMRNNALNTSGDA